MVLPVSVPIDQAQMRAGNVTTGAWTDLDRAEAEAYRDI